MALGVATVAIPLLALGAGYDAATVGFLAATSAASQLGTRFALPWLLGRFPDRSLIVVASLVMCAAFVLLLLSTALVVFAAAQLLQGAARAVFWTSSQTHAIRGEGPAVRGLVDLNVLGNSGTLVGPALGGSLAAIGLPVALGAAAGAAALAAVLALLLRRLPPYDRRRSAGSTRLLRREGVDVACWASVVGGAWWSMMGSFVPVAPGRCGLRLDRHRLAHHGVGRRWSPGAAGAATAAGGAHRDGGQGGRADRDVRAGRHRPCAGRAGRLRRAAARRRGIQRER